MAKKRYFQFTVKDKVQDVGLRLAIAKLIPDELDVRTDNLPEGSVRVVVRGYKQDVMRFWKALQQQVLGKAENPTFSGPAPMSTTSIETDRFFHKLQCEQMEKFVDVGLEMIRSIDGMSTKIGGMDGKLDGVGDKLDGVGGKIDGMSGKIDDMSSSIGSKLDGISTKLDVLPKNMANEIVRLKKEGFF